MNRDAINFTRRGTRKEPRIYRLHPLNGANIFPTVSVLPRPLCINIAQPRVRFEAPVTERGVRFFPSVENFPTIVPRSMYLFEPRVTRSIRHPNAPLSEHLAQIGANIPLLGEATLHAFPTTTTTTKVFEPLAKTRFAKHARNRSSCRNKSFESFSVSL